MNSVMKKKFHFLSRILLISFAFLFIASCHNLFDDDEPEPTNEYLISYELERSYLPVVVNQGFVQLVQQFPEMSFIRDRVQYGIMIYKIVYKTTLQGEEQRASGLVCVPMGEGTFPLLSYQNGTNTQHSNAPTVNPDFPLYQMLEFVASTGFIISLPDYLGFGSSDNMFHPYMHQESTVQSVIDMLRAVNELVNNYLDVNLKDELYLSGYSQGGWATMQVQKAIEEQYGSEFNLEASACAAGPYNLLQVNDYILSQNTYPMPYFAGYMFNSYMNLDITTTPIDSVFQDPYAGKIPTLYDGSKSGEQINQELTTSVADLFTANYRNNYHTDTTFSSLVAALEENSIGAWSTATPTRIYHGTDDQFIPYEVSETIYSEFQNEGAGNSVELIPLDGLGHTTGIVPAGLLSIEWFLELSGQSPN